MYVRKVKRKCGIRGCKNTDCFAVSKTREVGNTVIMCKVCMADALKAIKEMGPDAKTNIPVNDKASVPGLFFNAKALDTVKKQAEIPPEAEEASNAPELVRDAEDETELPTLPTDDVKDFICPVCGKEFDSEKGLKAHLRYCKPQTNEE